jgi:hypothetical protein
MAAPSRSHITFVAVLFICVLVAPHTAAGRCKESELHSGNIESHLSPGPGHPLVGFWRPSCENAFGLAIDQAGPGLYSISFCGPGGCFEPGTYRPNSSIIGDPAYRVVDPNTLEVLGADGFSTWHRCTQPVGSTHAA